jgi:ribokinase
MARKKKRARIVVVGSANVDLTTFTDRMPLPGETIFGTRFDLGFGGKGANQAVAASLCGARVHMVARVGDDLFGPATIKNLERQGVGTRRVKTVKGVGSGVAPIFVDPSGQNRILVVKGANDALTPEAVEKGAPLLKRADLVVLQLEIPLETVYYTIRFARKNRIRVLLNPAPAAPLSLEQLSGVTYLIPNETEAQAISLKSVTTIEDALESARELVARGFPRVVLTLGERGAILASAKSAKHLPAFRSKSWTPRARGTPSSGASPLSLARASPRRRRSSAPTSTPPSRPLPSERRSPSSAERPSTAPGASVEKRFLLHRSKPPAVTTRLLLVVAYRCENQRQPSGGGHRVPR